jgi:hypothetical protein
MPGAQDRWGQLTEPSAPNREAKGADFPHAADQRERGSIGDLMRRMERLPPGHPSSPYNDDMTRKPAVARLKDLELPLHGNEHSTNGAATNHGHDPAGDVHPTARAEAASSNGASNAGSPLSTASWADTGEWATTADGQGAANGLDGLVGGLGTAPDGPDGDSFGVLTDQPYSAPYETDGERYDAAGELDDAGEPYGDVLESTAESLRGTWLSTPAWDGAAEPGTADPDTADPDTADPDTADPDTASRGTSAWDSDSGWNGTSSWDDSAADRDGTNHDSGAGLGWSEPEPGVDTLTQAAISPEPGGELNGAGQEPLTGPDGSWEWNGRYLTPEECQIAEEALGRCRIAEGRNVFGGYGHSGLTPAMRRIEAQLEHGQLLPDTESSALKSPDSFKQKLGDLILRHPDKSADELSLEVHDGIRYAFIFEYEHYAQATLQAHSRLKGSGFDLEVRRNCWQNPEYKGINSRWRDPAHDLVFEVQYHTAASWDVRQRAHALYEAITDPATPPDERERLRTIHAELSAAVPAPPGSGAIPDFRKEGV